MSTTLPPQHPAIILRSSHRQRQALLATAVAIVLLAIAVAALAGATSTNSNRSGRPATLPIPSAIQTYPGLRGRG